MPELNCEMFEAVTASEEQSMWSGDDGLTEAVLGAVFEWLGGRQLARAGAVCRAWRRAAAAPPLWHRLLRRECGADGQALKALALHNAAEWQTKAEDKMDPATESDFNEYAWRDEYVRAVAGWRHVCSLRPTVAEPPASPGGQKDAGSAGGVGGAGGMGPALLHAALAPQGDALIVTADDASITVFIRTGQSADAWTMSWQASLRRRGWRAAARAEWAPGAEAGAKDGGRVLVGGPLALAERWELLVLQLGAGCSAAQVLARAGGAAGAAGCWLAADTFLSLELRLLAPGRGVTTVWLNSATQEEHSEFVGVAAPVLRIYNEAQAHISHVAVVETPTEMTELDLDECSPDALYLQCSFHAPTTRPAACSRVVVAACGRAGGPAGRAAALGCWRLVARGPPPLLAAAGGGLAERVARRRHALRVLDPEPPAPSEDEVRALCSPPAALTPLQDRLLGLTPHPSGRCVWAVEVGGRLTCASLPVLRVLRVLRASDVTPAPYPHYVQPALSTHYIASPVGDDWGRLEVWSAVSGARCSPPAPPAPRTAAPCALLAPAPPGADTAHASHAPAQLMVLAGDAVIPSRMVDDRHSTLRTHTGMALPSLPRLARLALPRAGIRAASDRPRDSCNPTPAPPCPPCTPHPRPPCRARPPDRVRALRVTCCPPPRGMRPSCATPLPACALDCTRARPQKDCPPSTTAIHEDNCDQGRDRVAHRLAASRDARRAEYMREVSERRPKCAPREPPYRLPGERECATATDGRQYAIAPPLAAPAPATANRACGPCRERPPPKCVELVPDNECQIRSHQYVDPCAHHPRVIVNIDRSKTRDTVDKSKNTPPMGQPSPPKCPEGLTSRIMKSLNLNRDGGGESTGKKVAKASGVTGGKAQYAGDTGWCGTIKPASGPSKCRPLDEKEKLRRRACRDIPCRQQPPNTRKLHTAATAWAKKEPKDMKSMAAQTKANVEKLEKMLNERAQFKEAAKGRTVDCSPRVAIPASGGIELPVPPGSAAVRVQVSLDAARSACAPSPTSSAAPPPPAAHEPSYQCAEHAPASKCSAPNTAESSSKNISRAVPVDNKCQSWLSIKTIQKKIAQSCRMSETSNKGPCKEPCQPKPSPCAPPPKRKIQSPPSNVPANPCAPSKKPSKKSESDEKKPACFTPVLTAVSLVQ